MPQGIENIDELIRSLIMSLSSESPIKRVQASNSLVHIGKATVPSLAEALTDHRETVRWEAAKALTRIHEPLAAAALVRALEDESTGVRWQAAEGLIALGKEGLIPLLQALIRQSDSVRLRQGAHHVLRSFTERPYSSQLAQVIQALDSPAPIMALPVAAFDVLKKL